MALWATALAKTRNLIQKVFSPSAGEIAELKVEEIEETLLQSDVPIALVMHIVDKLESASRRTDRCACRRRGIDPRTRAPSSSGPRVASCRRRHRRF